MDGHYLYEQSECFFFQTLYLAVEIKNFPTSHLYKIAENLSRFFPSCLGVPSSALC